MRALALLAAMTLLAGCQSEPPAPTPIIATETSITFDPRSCVSGQATLGWGLGSATVKILGQEDGYCVFEYTDEVEGGYKVYRCRVSVEASPVTIRSESSIDFGAYTAPGIVTSLSLDEAELLRIGNVFFDDDEP